MNRRVVITGLGVISSIGIGKDEFWKNLIKGKSGISRVTLFDTSRFKRHFAGEIKKFNPYDFIPEQMTKFLGRASQFTISALKLALKDSGIKIETIEKIAIIIGTTMTEANVLDFSSEMLLKDEWDEITFRLLLNSFSPSIPRNIGYFFQIKGRNILIIF
jgi:3-oxoacyl-[acyl-carrier-protein] synthase II